MRCVGSGRTLDFFSMLGNSPNMCCSELQVGDLLTWRVVTPFQGNSTSLTSPICCFDLLVQAPFQETP